MELSQKYEPDFKEVTTNSVSTKLFKDRIILHRNSMVFVLKVKKNGFCWETHMTSLTTKTNESVTDKVALLEVLKDT